MEFPEASAASEPGGRGIVEKTEMVLEGEEMESMEEKGRWNWKLMLDLGIELLQDLIKAWTLVWIFHIPSAS